jgi:paired amphipathic helix protein Sin3a
MLVSDLPLQYSTLKSTSGDDSKIHSSGSLAMRVCVRTYKLFYVSDTEDVIWRSISQEEYDKGARNLALLNRIKKRRLFGSSTHSTSSSRLTSPKAASTSAS